MKLISLKIILAILVFTEFAQAHYSPQLGRFLSRDPIEERGGENLHAFVKNNGINDWDRLGNAPNNAKPKEINIILTPKWDKSLSGYCKALSKNPPKGWRVAHYNGFFKAIDGKTNKGECIKTLELNAHGDPTGIDFITDKNVSWIGSQLRNRMCKKSKIYLSGCNTGLGKGTIPQTLADKSGCAVYATQGYCYGTIAQKDVYCTKTCVIGNITYPAFKGAKNRRGRWVYKKFKSKKPK